MLFGFRRHTGGRSIAWVDAGGMLRVGPESAGSFPEPACYGHGGERATLTDAKLVQGLLDPTTFADGQMTLSVDKARDAIRRDVAGPLGVSIEDGAALIAAVTGHDMVTAIEELALNVACAMLKIFTTFNTSPQPQINT